MMAHQELADFIKSVHIELRLRARDVGPNAAWEEHCANKNKLEKYAKAMQDLACIYWEKNNGESSEFSRIFWVYEKIDWYFNNVGRNEFLEKEKKLAQKFCIAYCPKEISHKNEVDLLDVGSCYNAFSKFPELNVTAIDLAPANENVYKCDFLSVTIGEMLIIEPPDICSQLPRESYDVVLFSLLLEYMPSPSQRFACCSKASLLLRRSGILIILTPDSKHASANSRLVRNWRLALASLGFLLLLTEKLRHIRCLIFAKSNDPNITKKWLSLQNCTIPPEEAIAIPQDRNPYENLKKEETVEENSKRSECDNKFIAESFSYLSVEDDIFN